MGIPVDRPSMRETTSLGAAIAAGFAVGVWKGFDELKSTNRENRRIFRPERSEKESAMMFKRWTKAVTMCKGWIEEEEQDIAGLNSEADDSSRPPL